MIVCNREIILRTLISIKPRVVVRDLSPQAIIHFTTLRHCLYLQLTSRFFFICTVVAVLKLSSTKNESSFLFNWLLHFNSSSLLLKYLHAAGKTVFHV